jgi:DNA-binding Lrp family transcriptional regulator
LPLRVEKLRGLRLCLMLLTGAITGSAALQTQAAELPIAGGPKELLISYRTKPGDRPAFRAYLQGEGAKRLAALKAEGVISGYQLIFNPLSTPGTWDGMAVVSFKAYGDTARWRELERTQPGGLTAAGQKLVTEIDTYSADLSWEATAKDASPESRRALYVIPYEYGAAEEYRAYVNSYVIPQVEGWMREGVLSRYRIYMNRYPVGRPWDALFIYEYRDLDNFGRRDETVAKVRAPLRQNPEWKRLNDIKSKIRSETENTQAEILVSE